jgi:hypothetical protein
MYTIPILWMISWPLLVFVSYLVVMWTVKKYEGRLEEQNEEQ